MRTNRNGVTENSEFNIDHEKLGEGIVRVFGEKPSQFCPKCDLRFSLCKCKKEADENPKYNCPMPEMFQVWVNKENNCKYTVAVMGMMRIMENTWIDSVTYSCQISLKTYTRDLESFLEKFIRVS